VGTLAGIAAYGIWGSFPLYFHHAAPASALELLFHRMAWTLVLLVVVLALARSWSWVRQLSRATVARLALAAAALSTNWGVYIWAVANDHVVDAALGYFINPLVTVTLGVLLLGERLRSLQLGAVALGALSVVVLTVGYGRVPWIALTLASSFATYGYLKKTVALPALRSLAVETVTMAPVAVVGLAIVGAQGESTFTGSGTGHTAFLVSTGLVTAVPLVLFGVAAPRIPLSQLGLLQYLTPVLQMLCGVLAFHEAVPLERWIGFAVVWCALGLLLLDAMRTTRREPVELALAEVVSPPGAAGGASSTARPA
jgi:chloramphenicol-sensitive protein RarD